MPLVLLQCGWRKVQVLLHFILINFNFVNILPWRNTAAPGARFLILAPLGPYFKSVLSNTGDGKGKIPNFPHFVLCEVKQGWYEHIRSPVQVLKRFPRNNMIKPKPNLTTLRTNHLELQEPHSKQFFMGDEIPIHLSCHVKKTPVWNLPFQLPYCTCRTVLNPSAILKSVPLYPCP